MTRTEVDDVLQAIEQRLGLLSGQLTYEDWVEYKAIFDKRSPRDLTWACKYIRKLHDYIDSLERHVAAEADPAGALRSKAGEPSMRAVRKSQPRIEIEPPPRTDDLPTMGDASAMRDAFTLEEGES